MYCAGVYDRDSYSVKEIITEIILLSFNEEIYFKNLLIPAKTPRRFGGIEMRLRSIQIWVFPHK